MEHAEQLASDAREWLECARTRQMLGDAHGVAECLRQAEIVAKCKRNWSNEVEIVQVAEGWKRLLDDDVAASRCLDSFEVNLDGINDWLLCAKIRATVLGDRKHAMRCLTEAESLAYSGSNFLACAEAWKDLLDDTTTARRCLDQAIAIADTAEELGDCSLNLGTCFADDVGALDLLKRAEAAAETSRPSRASHAWYTCAWLWSYLFLDSNRTRLCVRRAEEAATTESDWKDCASIWRKQLFDEHEAARCEAEARALKH